MTEFLLFFLSLHSAVPFSENFGVGVARHRSVSAEEENAQNSSLVVIGDRGRSGGWHHQFLTQCRCPRALALSSDTTFFALCVPCTRQLSDIYPRARGHRTYIACCCCGFLGEDELFIDCKCTTRRSSGHISQRRNYYISAECVKGN